MTEAPTCYRCEGPMDLGFIADAAHGGILQSRWCAGEPEKSWLTEIKPRQFKAGLKTFSYRCPTCGLLETFALDRE